MVPLEMKNLTAISAFKREVKNWKLETVQVGYIQNVGYIETLSIWLFTYFLFFSLLNFKLLLVVPCSHQNRNIYNVQSVNNF